MTDNENDPIDYLKAFRGSRKQRAKLHARAMAIGGGRLISAFIRVEDFPDPPPWEETQLRKLWGIGAKAIEGFKQLGFVKCEPFEGLNVTAKNKLYELGIKTVEEAKVLVSSGKLTVGDYRYYGYLTHKKLCKYLGLPIPPKTKRVRCCPHCLKVISGKLGYIEVEKLPLP